MRKILSLTAVIIGLVLLPATGLAKKPASHPPHPNKAATDPTLVCDGTNCTYTATGLTPGDKQQTSFKYVPDSNTVPSCNTGEGGHIVNADGSISYTDTEDWLIGCNGPADDRLPGTLTAWMVPVGGMFFDEVPGTEISIHVTS
jgi:hypothetical protein